MLHLSGIKTFLIIKLIVELIKIKVYRHLYWRFWFDWLGSQSRNLFFTRFLSLCMCVWRLASFKILSWNLIPGIMGMMRRDTYHSLDKGNGTKWGIMWMGILRVCRSLPSRLSEEESVPSIIKILFQMTEIWSSSSIWWGYWAITELI